MKRTTFARTAALTAALAAVTGAAVAVGPAFAGQSGSAEHGTPGTGQILPHPGPDGVLWIPDWIGDGGAVTVAGNSMPATVTVGCRGGSGSAGEVQVRFTPSYGDLTPVEFTVACPADTVGLGSVVVAAETSRSFQVGVTASAPDVHWGLTVTQPDA
ncbi:hypothetical protein ACFV4P_31645 [Kitasatospora sp. NPDC059795]|uniref:hypothetical protein n=1 Tax=Kitasatospora sp. NPDC059795 TaxID=3346949 RepID=UPI003664DA7B